MAWVAVAVGGSALLGAHQANEAQRAQAKHNQAAAEHNRYSNWTGRTMQQRFGAPDALTGALKGGLAGFGAARAFGGIGGAAGADPTGATTNAPTFTNSDNFSQKHLYGGGSGNPYQNILKMKA